MSKFLQVSLILKGILLSTILAILLSLIFGFLLSFTSLPESELSLNLIFAASIFVSAFITAHHAGIRGLYYGIAVGAGFVALALVLSAVLWTNTPSWLDVGEKTILSLVSGGVGGIIGVLIPKS
jgi:putative membrane protein (TIGR04086 family)